MPKTPREVLEALVPHITRDHPSLSDLLGIITLLTLDVRKLLIDALRIGDPIRLQPRLRTTLFSLFASTPRTLSGDTVISTRYISDLVDKLNSTTMLRSFAIMFLHCAPIDPSISDEPQVLVQTFLKELTASQTEFAEGQQLSYTAWFSPDQAIAPSPYTQLDPPWTQKAKALADTWLDRFSELRHRTIFPAVQRSRNLSHNTGYRAELLGWDGEPTKIRSVDLETFYAETGEMVGGEAEMRSAWRYNDVKPRVYYAMGGRDYWSSRYIKPFAIEAMEANRITSQRMRTHPDELLWLQNDNFSVWDYASFTTTLSELRFFLYHFARHILDHTHALDLQPVFDYREGIKHINVGEHLLHYNHEANSQAAFNIGRLAHLLGAETVVPEIYRQQNSGMLGVPGNIGFSTTLHGVAMQPVVLDGAATGDDACAEHEIGRGDLTSHLGMIGDPQPMKSATFHPRELQFSERVPEVWKHLKRRLEVFEDHIELGHLFSIPNWATSFEQYSDSRRSPSDTTPEAVTRRVLTAVGSLFWDIHKKPYLIEDDTDLSLLFEYLRRIYARLRIPARGCLPGQIRCSDDHKDRSGVLLAVPPLNDFDPRYQDWAEFLYDRCQGTFFRVPMFSDSEIMPPVPLLQNKEFHATSGGLVTAMVDLRIVEQLGVISEIVEADDENRRRFLISMSPVKKHLVYRYVLRDSAEVPSWYYTAVHHLHKYVAVPYVELAEPEVDNHEYLTQMYGWNLI